MDINAGLDEAIASDEREATIVINQKNGEPYRSKDGEPCTISFLGSESKAYRKESDAIARALLHSKKTKLEPSDLEKNRVRQVAAVVTQWTGWENGDVPAPCTPENVKRLLRAEHVIEQVEQGIRAHADFFGSSSSSASSTSAGNPSSAA